MTDRNVNYRLTHWLVALLILPLVGAAIYLIYRPAEPINQVDRIFLDSDTVLITDPADLALVANDLDRRSKIRTLLLETADSADRSFAELKKLSNARAVHCCYFQVGSYEMKSLIEMPSIEELSIFGSRISDEAAEILANDQKIKKLTFSLAGVSPEMASRIKTARPDLDFQQEE